MAGEKNKISRKIDRENEATEARVESFVTALQKFLRGGLEDIIDGLDVGLDQAAAAAQALGGLEVALEELGLDDVLSDIAEVYGEKLRTIQEKFLDNVDIDAPLNEVDVDVVEQLIQFDLESVKTKVYATTSELKSAVLRAVIVGDPDMMKVVDTRLDGLGSRLNTELNTGLAGFERAVTLAKADEFGVDLFLYAGGLIKTSREFCIERAGKVFSRDEIESWDNGQGLPTLLYLGGYNCQHDLQPVSPALARQLGYEG